MDWKELIPEIKEYNKAYRRQRNLSKRAYNKFKNSVDKYTFLDVIIKPKDNGREEDILLENAIKDLFNSIGIESKKPKTLGDFDVISKFKKDAFGIEVKNGNLPSENDMFQAHKYAMRTDKKLRPLIIWNNATTNQEFDGNRIKDAQLSGYGIMTTKDLYSAYIKLKMNKISFESFYNQLKKTGSIKFSMKELNKPINSEAAR